MFKWVKVNAIQRGVLLKEIAEKTGYSYSGFNQIINGFRKPPKGFKEKVEKVFMDLIGR